MTTDSNSPSPADLISAGETAMRTRRWAEAAHHFNQIPNPDSGLCIKRNLSRNLAAMQQHRPAIYDLLITLPKNDDVGMGTSASGHPTIVCRVANGKNIALSPGNLPANGLVAAITHLKPVVETGTSFALAGLGDGYLLHHLANHPPRLYLDTELSVFVLEPNAHIVLTALMVHDYSGPTGPIEQTRFHWFIGKSWSANFRQTILNDLLLPCPHVSIALGLEADAIQKFVNGVVAELAASDQRHREMIADYYASLAPAELANVFGEDPPRRPRALLLTTRFSTVLQFSTNDVAVALQKAGWETHVMIEPTRHHRIMTIATRNLLATFKPDLVFQIDHHRQEHPGIFPDNLPFVCWIQDHMEQLMMRPTGAKLCAHDFVLTDAGPVYVHNYDYPARQIIAMPKLTAPPVLLPRPSGRGDDLVYISNNARSPQALLDLLLSEARGNAAEAALLTECWTRLIALHEANESVANFIDVCELLRELAVDMGIAMSEPRFIELARIVNHPVCDALYRQQTLKWAADAADALGLRMALYGKGWETHPHFARFARGPIAHGRDQQELTRRSAINFQISPYICLHQRLLDGICAGGFFLVRKHIADVAPQAMLELLETHCGSHISTLNAARACVPPPVRDRFERLVKECNRCLRYSGNEDPIEAVRAFQEAQLLQKDKGVLPHLESISFSDAAGLRQCIERYVNDAGLRERINADQRESIGQRFTYAAAMRRMRRRIGELLPAETNNAFIGNPIKIDIGRAA